MKYGIYETISICHDLTTLSFLQQSLLEKIERIFMLHDSNTLEVFCNTSCYGETHVSCILRIDHTEHFLFCVWTSLQGAVIFDSPSSSA